MTREVTDLPDNFSIEKKKLRHLKFTDSDWLNFAYGHPTQRTKTNDVADCQINKTEMVRLVDGPGAIFTSLAKCTGFITIEQPDKKLELSPFNLIRANTISVFLCQQNEENPRRYDKKVLLFSRNWFEQRPQLFVNRRKPFPNIFISLCSNN